MKNIIYAFLIFFSNVCQSQTTLNKETNAAIDEKSFIELGGEKQYVEITGASSKNPVLLFLHGGPGWPQTPHLRYFNSDLTKSVILVAWEQSGCGKSYMNNPEPKNLSLEQLISDAHQLTQILKKKFGQKKIYLAGFSWGSVIGFHLIQRYPEDYTAYFGISQIIDINRSIDLSIGWIEQQAKEKGDKKMEQLVTQLKNKDTSFCKNQLECFYKKYELLTEFGGAIYKKESEAQVTIAETKYEDYKNYDWLKGFMYSASRIGNVIFSTDFTATTRVHVPIYFFVGRHDWSLPSIVTEEFVNKLTAPKKEIVWFENSGHECLEEEPAKFNKEIIDRIIK